MKQVFSTNVKSITVQRIEQRSIRLYSETEGYHSLPIEPINRTVFSKTDEERAEIATQRTNFVGTEKWIEQCGRRIGHVAVANQKRYSKGIFLKQTTRSYFRKLKKNSLNSFFDSLKLN